jgi:large subunit ribosomal protein L10
MKREEKTAVVEELASRLGEAEAIFAVDYKGISVPQAAELRTKLRESDAAFSVVKNRLAKRAAEQAGTEGLDDLLVGPTALTLIKGDPVTVAKTITTFTKEHDVLAYKGGIMDGAPLDADAFQAIAKLPGVDQLRGQLVGLVASPLTGLAAGMNNLISGLGRQLAQIAEQGLVSGSAADPSPAVVEAADVSGEAPAAEVEADPEAAEEEPEAEAEAEPEAEEGKAEAEEPPAEETSEAADEEAPAETDDDTEEDA